MYVVQSTRRTTQASHTSRSTTLTAADADPLALYVEAFQDPSGTAAFLSHLYRERHGHHPGLLREDFCGTAINCLEWLRMNPEGEATGVDLHSTPLRWCRSCLLPHASADQNTRLRLVQADAMDVRTPQVDILAALNSSFCVLKRRGDLLRYLERCHAALAPGGVMVLEVYAGPEAQMVGRDEIPCDGFTAVWEQASFNAVTHETSAHIHFCFPDGTRLDRAFSYDYRLWSVPELVDALAETGFSEQEVHRRGQSAAIAPCRQVDVPDHWSACVVASV